MSRWINKDLFDKFVEVKKNEKETTSKGTRRSELAWRNPDKGTPERAKVYVGRFLTDPKGQFYKKYFYHMFQIGEQWNFFLCPKTYNMDNYCPFCSATSKLYTGTKSDKAVGSKIRRKEKFAGNWFVIDDPRDAEAKEDGEKVNGSVRVWEFPGKVEVKIKEQITDSQNGLGPLVFDPSENGFDFILKITSTKKDNSGNVWPDYNLSEFSRKAHAIADSEKEIDNIMKTTIDLDDYIESMERDEEDMIASLKQLMVWDLIESEWKRSKGQTAVRTPIEEDIPDFNNEKEKDEPPFDVDDNDGGMSDDELLRELDALN